jgi:hypothetical protein
VLTNQACDAMTRDAARAQERAGEALEAARRGGTAIRIAHTTVNLAAAHFLRGEWEEVRSLVADADRATGKDFATALTFVGALTGWACGEPGPRALDAQAMTGLRDPFGAGMAAGVTMIDALLAGEHERAARAGREAARLTYEAGGLFDDLVHVWPVAAEAAVLAGDDEALSGLYAMVDAVEPGLVPVAFTAHRALAAALAARAAGSTDEAVELLRSAVRDYERWGAPAWRARAEADLAGLLGRLGRTDEAARLRVSAMATLQPLGATGWLAAAGLAAAPTS